MFEKQTKHLYFNGRNFTNFTNFANFTNFWQIQENKSQKICHFRQHSQNPIKFKDAKNVEKHAEKCIEIKKN